MPAIAVKLDPNVLSLLREDVPFTRFGRQRRTATKFGQADLDRVLSAYGIIGIRRLFRVSTHDAPLNGWFLLRVKPNRTPASVCRELLQSPHVLEAEPEHPRTLHTPPIVATSEHAQEVHMDNLLEQINWPSTFAQSANVRFPSIAVIDSGISSRPHPQLPFAAIEQWDVVDAGPFAPLIGWRWNSADLTLPDRDATDEIGHGTHVAGIAAGRRSDRFCGVSPNSTLVAIRALAPTTQVSTNVQSAHGTTADVASAVRKAIERRAAVINMSFGFRRSSSLEEDAVDAAADREIAIIAAIGNDGPNAADLRPAKYRNVIAVGAVDSGGSPWPGSQGGSHLFLSAPGVGVLSCDLAGGFTPLTGTSMACAVVSGTVALLKARRPNLTVSQIRDVLKRTCRRPPGAGHSTRLGWGILDAGAALAAVQ